MSEKANNTKHSKTKLPWFSCLLWYSARKRGGLILRCSGAHTHRNSSNWTDRKNQKPTSVM